MNVLMKYCPTKVREMGTLERNFRKKHYRIMLGTKWTIGYNNYCFDLNIKI